MARQRKFQPLEPKAVEALRWQLNELARARKVHHRKVDVFYDNRMREAICARVHGGNTTPCATCETMSVRQLFDLASKGG